MKHTPILFLSLILLSLMACGGQTDYRKHFDTTLVDTIMAIDLDSPQVENGKVVTDWLYNADSTLALLESQRQAKSVITASQHMKIFAEKSGGLPPKLYMVLTDGERFAGNSYDSSNVVRLYAHGKELAKLSYQPGVSKQTDTAFVDNSSALLNCLRTNSRFKVETSTFTSGTLVYEFNSLSTLKAF